MASIVDSVATFRKRASEVGVSEPNVNAIIALGVDTLAKLAFAIPNAEADEAAMAQFLTERLDGAPSLGQVASFRRLHFEAKTLCLAQVRAQVERSHEDVPIRIPGPERVARYEAQQRRVSGISLTGEMEPSFALISLVAQMAADTRTKTPAL